MSKGSRDIIAESNKKLVITTLLVAAVIALINAVIFGFTPLGDNLREQISKAVNEISGPQSTTIIIDNSSNSQTFERRITDLLDSLTKSGNLTRTGLGIRYITITDEIAAENNLPVKNGVLIPSDDSIIKGMPAEKAGFRAGDIITKIDNTKIDEDNPLNYLIAKHAVGDTVSVTYLRDGEERIVSVKLAKLKTN